MSSEVVVRVDVTAEDIANGVRIDCAKCPVARAARYATGRNDVEASQGGISIGEMIFAAPHRVAEFISYFDRGSRVYPFAFDLTLPAELVLKGGET